MLRDALLPVLWFDGWRGRGFVWRGNAMTAEASDRPEPV
jgi:ceramide glucosyltransferase